MTVTVAKPQTSIRHVFLTAREAARFLNISFSWLNKARCSGEGPPYVKIGGGLHGRVVYRQSDLEKWMESRVRHHTSEA